VSHENKEKSILTKILFFLALSIFWKIKHKETLDRICQELLKGDKWKEVENKNLVKVTWTEGAVLCNICYIGFVENPLKRG